MDTLSDRKIDASASLGSVRARVVGTLVGSVAFWIYSRTWQDIWHLIYDVPAALAVYSFVAQLLAEGLAGSRNRWWVVRVVALVFMSVVTVGREFGHWPVSGHLTTTVAVSVIQLCESRLRLRWRLAYLTPLPVVVLIRLFVFDRSLAMPLVSALLVGLLIGTATVVARPKA